MTLEDFNALTPEEQQIILNDHASLSERVGNLEAERDSFRTENESLIRQAEESKEELKKTKEMNYTLTRQLNVSDRVKKSAEELLSEAFN